jgi:hypothetical protein
MKNESVTIELVNEGLNGWHIMGWYAAPSFVYSTDEYLIAAGVDGNIWDGELTEETAKCAAFDLYRVVNDECEYICGYGLLDFPGATIADLAPMLEAIANGELHPDDVEELRFRWDSEE